MRNPCLSFFFSTFLVTSTATVAFADADNAVRTPDVVISATRIPVPAREVASSVTVIDREQIEQKQKQTVADLLRDVPGVQVTQSGGPGQTARVFIRGAESRHTLVLIDGVEVNDPSDVGNAFEFNYLSTDNIERIEVLRGPQSGIYGADAIGGVINITTRAGKGKPGVNALAGYGSYGTQRAQLGSSGEVGRVNYSVSASRFKTDGISAINKRRGATEDDATDTHTLSANIGTNITDNFSTRFVGRMTDAYAEFDNFDSDSTVSETDSRQWNGRVSGELKLFDGRWTQELGFGGMRLNRDSQTEFGTFEFNGNRVSANWVHHLQLMDKNTLSLGVEQKRDDFKTDSDSSRETILRSAFAEDQIQLMDNLFATLSLRHDDHSRFGGETTWRIAPAYIIAQTGTKLKGTYGTGFKAPSLFQLYSIFGNPDLRPEKSKGYDIGFEQNVYGDLVSFGSTWFHNDIEDLIGFALSRYLNVQEAETKGLENFIAWRPLPDFTLTLNHTYLITEDKSTGFELLRRARHSFSVTADAGFWEKGRAQATVRGVGERADVDFNASRTILPGNATVDLNATWALTGNVSLIGKIDNLLDRDYEELYGYGTPGMTVFTGLRVEY